MPSNPADHPAVVVDTLLGSNEPGEDNYGQNGYQGPSSDTPGTRTSNKFLQTECNPKAGDWQTRKVSQELLSPAHGHRDRNANAAQVPVANIRRASFGKRA